MVINGAIVSDLDMMYIESVLQVSQSPELEAFCRPLDGNESAFYPELTIRKREVHYFQSLAIDLTQTNFGPIASNLKRSVVCRLCFHDDPDMIRSLYYVIIIIIMLHIIISPPLHHPG